MKHLLFPLFLLPVLAFAQTVDRQVIGSTGGVVTAGGTTLSFTVGEVVTATVTAGSFTLTQGFQQPDGSGTISNDPLIQVDYQVYPNPTRDWVEVKLISTRKTELRARVVDMLGRDMNLGEQVAQLPGEAILRFDLSALAEATYLIRIFAADGKEAHSVRVQVFK